MGTVASVVREKIGEDKSLISNAVGTLNAGDPAHIDATTAKRRDRGEELGAGEHTEGVKSVALIEKVRGLREIRSGFVEA